ncbi:MAG: hypothetical protein IJM90_04605 [Firmicutes bacterium]|nr:hypothetical protein [Bacillota bacterium]
MSDLISRQVAVDDLRSKDPSQVWDTADVEVWVNALPSAEPEIVRCKDCKHFHENVFGEEIGIGAPYDNLIVGHYGCSRLAGDKDMIYMKPDGFCSLGERRGEENGHNDSISK